MDSMFEYASDAELELRKPEPSDLQAAAGYRLEMLEEGSSMDGCSNLRRFEDINDWYAWIKAAEKKESCPENWVPDSQYICLRRSDGRLVGMLDIRHELNEQILRLFGGIGYSIRPSERGKGYGTAQLALAKQICRSMGMKRVLITCHKENLPSAAIIKANGGVLESEAVDDRNGQVLERYWIEL